MKQQIEKYIKTLDFYGIKVNLNFKKEQQHSTFFGTFVSFFVVALFALGCYIYGKELLDKKKPIVLSNERFVRNPQRMDFDRVQQTMMMGFRHIKGFAFSDPSIYQVKAQLYIMTRQYNDTLKINQTLFVVKDIKVRPCTINDIQVQELKEFFQQLELNQLACFDDDQEVYIEGDISGDYYTRAEIYFKQCQNSTKAGSVVCASQEKIDSYLKQAHFVAYIIDKLIDPSNLEKPFSYQAINLYSQCSNKLSKEITAYFSNYYIESDLGIINEDIQQIHDFIFVEQQEAISFEDPQIVAKLILRPQKNRETVLKRRYMKVSDLIAQIGGLFNLVTIIGSLITIPFVKFHLNKEIVNNIFDFDYDDQKSEQDNQNIQKLQTINQNNKNSLNQESSRKYLNNQIDSKRQLSKFYNQSIVLNDMGKQNSINFSETHIHPIQTKSLLYQTTQQVEYPKNNENQVNIEDSTLFSPNLTAREQDINIIEKQKQQAQGQMNNNQNSMLRSISQWTREKLKPIKRTINYSIFEMLQHVLFPVTRNIRKKKPFIDKSIEKVQSHLDIQYMLNKFQEVDKLKQILLTEDQIKLFELIPRPLVKMDIQTKKIKINSKYFNEEKSYEEKYEDANTSLSNILNKEKKSQRDLKLIELLDPNIMKLIEADLNLKNGARSNSNEFLKMSISYQNDEIKEIFNTHNNQSIYDQNQNSGNSTVRNFVNNTQNITYINQSFS